jgi:hypothetical protein
MMKKAFGWIAGKHYEGSKQRRSSGDQPGKKRLERRDDGVVYPVLPRETRAGPSQRRGDFNPFAYNQQAADYHQGDTGYPQPGYYQDENPYQRAAYPQARADGPGYNTMEQQFEAPEAVPRTETSIRIENINARIAPLAERVDVLVGLPDTHYTEEYGKIMAWHPGYVEGGTSKMDRRAQGQIKRITLLHQRHKNDGLEARKKFDSKWNNRGGERDEYVDSAPDEVTRQERFLEVWEPLIGGLETEHVGEWQGLANELAMQRYPTDELKKLDAWFPNYSDDTSKMGKLAQDQAERIKRLRRRPDSDMEEWQALATRLEEERTKAYTDLTTRFDDLIGWLDLLQQTEAEKIIAWQIRTLSSPRDSADQIQYVGQFVNEYAANINEVRANFVTAYEAAPDAALLNVWNESLDEQETTFREALQTFITNQAARRYEASDFSAYEALLS